MTILDAAIPVLAGAGLCAWAGLHPRSQLFGPSVRRVADGCALTFDDGPNPEVTPRLLDLLGKHGISATFFVLGKYVKLYPDLAAEIADREHHIGNHTDTHPNLLFFSPLRIAEELRQCEDAIHSATGAHSSCVRPPFGFRGPQFHSVARTAGLSKVVAWSVNGRDWKPQPATSTIRRLEKVAEHDIILLHDGDHRASKADRNHTLLALEYWLPRWTDSGLKFVTL